MLQTAKQVAPEKLKKDLMRKGCGMGSSSCRNNALQSMIGFEAALLPTARTNVEKIFNFSQPQKS